MGERQHDPDRDRTFVRALQGKNSLTEELGRCVLARVDPARR